MLNPDIGEATVMSDVDREQRIRERAYKIWLEAGQPDGHSKEHWSEAEKQLAEEDNADPENKTVTPPSPGPYENIG
jgi:Protein of unknown function (DUF2934)